MTRPDLNSQLLGSSDQPTLLDFDAQLALIDEHLAAAAKPATALDVITVQTKYSGPGVPKFGYYMPEVGDPGYRIAIMIMDPESEERLCVATVNMDSYPGDGCVFIKDWSENEGMSDAIVESGLAEEMEESQASGYVVATKFRLTALALQELARQDPDKPPMVQS